MRYTVRLTLDVEGYLYRVPTDTGKVGRIIEQELRELLYKPGASPHWLTINLVGLDFEKLDTLPLTSPPPHQVSSPTGGV